MFIAFWTDLNVLKCERSNDRQICIRKDCQLNTRAVAETSDTEKECVRQENFYIECTKH